MLLDSLVDSAVDHVVPDGLETDEQLSDPADESTESLYEDHTEGITCIPQLQIRCFQPKIIDIFLIYPWKYVLWVFIQSNRLRHF